MTHKEDITRVTTDVVRSSTDDTVDFLNARIKAMTKRIEYLEAIIEVEILNNYTINIILQKKIFLNTNIIP